MNSFVNLLKTSGSLLYQVIAILCSVLKTIIAKFWKVIVVIFTFIISILTLRAFKKKGGNLE